MQRNNVDGALDTRTSGVLDSNPSYLGSRTKKSAKELMQSYTKASFSPPYYLPSFECHSLGREAFTGRRVAIKKIKVGQFKDGLDMSAIREVKYLRELKHQNIIEVCGFFHPLAQTKALVPSASRCFLFKNKS